MCYYSYTGLYCIRKKSRTSWCESWGGGLWNASTEDEQLEFYHTLMANYIYLMTKYNIPTIFINFERMITDKQYLFTILRSVLEEKQIDFDLFSTIYDDVSRTSKPK